MKIAIDGELFDTEKGQHWPLARWDGSNWSNGDLYLSSSGTMYVHTPSQWSDMRGWELVAPVGAVERYRDYLTDDDIEEICAACGLEGV